jgi:hypothetical protein
MKALQSSPQYVCPLNVKLEAHYLVNISKTQRAGYLMYQKLEGKKGALINCGSMAAKPGSGRMSNIKF